MLTRVFVCLFLRIEAGDVVIGKIRFPVCLRFAVGDHQLQIGKGCDLSEGNLIKLAVVNGEDGLAGGFDHGLLGNGVLLRGIGDTGFRIRIREQTDKLRAAIQQKGIYEPYRWENSN